MRNVILMILAMALVLSDSNVLLAQEQQQEATRGIIRMEDVQEPRKDVLETPAVEGEGRVLPSLPSGVDESRDLAAAGKIFVKSLRLEGNTVLDQEAIEPLISRFQGRPVSAAELRKLCRELSQLYVNRGYINSGVILPDQEIVDGTVVLRAIEAEPSRVSVSGNKRLKDRYVRPRIARGLQAPLNVMTLQNQLRLLERDPLIEKINASLLPGDRPGQSVLDVKITESDPIRFAAGVNNYRNPSVGEIRGYLRASHLNITGYGDRLHAEVGLTEGLNDLDLLYLFPVTSRGTMLGAEYNRSDSTVVEEPFDEIDIDSETTTGRFFVTHPFVNRLNTRLSGTMGLDLKKNKTKLLGEPFSFSEGVEDGKSKVSVLWLESEWVKRWLRGVLACRGTLRFGLDMFDATINDEEPDGKFELVQLQGQYLHRFESLRSEVMLRLVTQLTDDPLLDIEKFGVGGRYSVRGYRENLFVRENGVVGTLEGRLPFTYQPRSGPGLNYTLVGFLDYGRAWDEKRRLVDKRTDTIWSVGAGMVWSYGRHLRGELFYGVALNDPDGEGDKLQDHGVHFMVEVGSF